MPDPVGECPSPQRACEQRLYSFTYALNTQVLCKRDDGHPHSCCTKVLAAKVESSKAAHAMSPLSFVQKERKRADRVTVPV